MLLLRRLAALAAMLAAVAAAPAWGQGDPATLIALQEPVVADGLVISQVWSRATPPGAPTAAGYLTITNTGTAPDRLLAVTSPIAANGDIHAMEIVDGVMTMRHLEGGLPIPPGGSVTLQPGGHHLMFVNLTGGLVAGTVVTATLTFEIAGAVEINLIVFPVGSPGPAQANMGGMGGP